MKAQRAKAKAKTVVIRKKSKKVSSIKEYVKGAPETTVAELAKVEFETKLEEISNFTAALGLRFINGIMDGREVSKKREWEVTGPITDYFKNTYSLKKDRVVGDFYINTKFGNFPVNVKIIEDKSKVFNNICGPITQSSHLMYGETSNSAVSLANKMRTREFTKTPQNYGILVVNKGTGEVKWTTLFGIKKVKVNPSNGLQFSMYEMEHVNRTQLEGQHFVKNNMTKLFEKQAAPLMTLYA